MFSVAINGKFFSEQVQGVARYGRELVPALDEVLDKDDYVELVIPPDAKDVPPLQNIKVVPYGKRRGIAWEQLDFARYLRKHRELMALNFCNVAPLLSRPGVTTVHDIMYKTCPEFYSTPRNKVSRLWHCLQYAIVMRRELAIITVSEYSKAQIERNYPSACGKVHVVYDCWQHVLDYEEASDWQERYPQLVSGEFLFTVATRARNKNSRWVFEVARRNPKLTFAVAGTHYDDDSAAVPPNVHLLGYVSDADVCALMKNCRAFLYPSLYEGFGLPPLEALALGAQVVSSNATSLPEVLGGAVHYVDPTDYGVDLDEVLAQPVAPAQETLDRYSWEGSAKLLCDDLGLANEAFSKEASKENDSLWTKLANRGASLIRRSRAEKREELV